MSGLPVTLETLEDPNATIEWSVTCAVLERLEEECGGPEGMIELGRALNPPAIGKLWNVLRFAVSPRQVYFLATRWVGPKIVPFAASTFEVQPDGRFVVTIEIPPTLQGCLPFFRVSHGLYEISTRWIGLGDAVVEADLTPHRGVYTVTPPPSHSLWARLGRVFEVFGSSRTAIEELSEQYAELSRSAGRLRESEARGVWPKTPRI